MKVKLCQHILLNTSKSINSYKVFEKGFFKKICNPGSNITSHFLFLIFVWRLALCVPITNGPGHYRACDIKFHGCNIELLIPGLRWGEKASCSFMVLRPQHDLGKPHQWLPACSLDHFPGVQSCTPCPNWPGLLSLWATALSQLLWLPPPNLGVGLPETLSRTALGPSHFIHYWTKFAYV